MTSPLRWKNGTGEGGRQAPISELRFMGLRCGGARPSDGWYGGVDRPSDRYVLQI